MTAVTVSHGVPSAELVWFFQAALLAGYALRGADRTRTAAAHVRAWVRTTAG